MTRDTAFAAVDLGAESGRVMVGVLRGERAELDLVHRFANVPVRTPDVIVRRFHAEIARALKLPDVRGRFDALGVSPSGVSPEEFGKFVHEDYERIGKYVKQADIRLD